VDANDQSIQQRSQGLQAGLDCWRNRYLWTYLYFDDSFLRENYYRRLPTIGLATGILWYTHRTPSTIYAMAKAIIQLCPHSPTAPLPDFQSLSPKQKEGIYHHIEGSSNPARWITRWISVTILLLMRHWLAEPLDQTSNPVETEATKSSERNTEYTTYLSKCWWLQPSVNTR
jgi:hypothetical protein